LGRNGWHAAEESSQYLPSFLDYVNGYCLEFTELGERSGATNEWNVVGARLLRTYGGPHAIIEWNYTNSIVVDVQWEARTLQRVSSRRTLRRRSNN